MREGLKVMSARAVTATSVVSPEGVTDAAVVGLPRDDGSEQVVAAVTVDGDVDVQALREHCRSSLAAYKVPRRVVELDELPKSLIGKVLRREVRDRLIAAG